LKELVELAATGKLKWKETIAQGLEAAPEAFFGMLKGKNFGKQLVKLI
ncbi:MAG TPA: NADP-dependent oxidoreductase, partial [Beijerinckiaceae bacterium]|nr:NADP-dependent oxidoreductase [Beijerinckiaceae bacterium]